jgi:hypothetical protein
MPAEQIAHDRRRAALRRVECPDRTGVDDPSLGAERRRGEGEATTIVPRTT